MARKDISDLQVLQAYVDAEAARDARRQDPLRRAAVVWPHQLLMERTGQCEKVCRAAMNRAFGRGLIDYGVSLHAGFLTDAGKALMARGASEAA